jgi:hypothetical protein
VIDGRPRRGYRNRVRRRAAILFALIAIGVVSIPGGAGAVTESGIKGVVLDATCYGPCRYPPGSLPPYTGPGLTVAIRTVDGKLVARLHPNDGRFAVAERPGTYRVRARVDTDPSCWRGEVKTVTVQSGSMTGVRLHVTNECIR